MDKELEELYAEIENAFSVTMNEGLLSWDKERGMEAFSWDTREDGKLDITWKGKEYVLILQEKK
jgi:hypothetical protein